MPNCLIPILDILPPSQRSLWDELTTTPPEFILYGGTAIALQLGHRISVDFDFFSHDIIHPDDLLRSVPYLQNAVVLQQDAKSLTCLVEREEPVKVSYFGLPWMGRVRQPLIVPNRGLKIASLLDLAATKTLTVQQRAELKDYLDIVALIGSGIELDMMLSAAVSIYATTFNPQLTLKALCYFDEGSVSELSQAHRNQLLEAVAKTRLDHLPNIAVDGESHD
jgi:hypothetical protein